MGYNLSIRAVHRVENYLQTMVASNEDIVWRPPEDVTPFYLAYWIREGIRAAEFLAEKGNVNLQQYTGLLDKFIIRHKRETVIAELKLSKLASFRVNLGILTLHEPTDALEIIGAALKHKQAVKIFFPNGVPDKVLYNWTYANGWKIVHDEEMGTTLVKGELDGVEEWTPQ